MSAPHQTSGEYLTVYKRRNPIGRLAYRPERGGRAKWHVIMLDGRGAWFTSKAAATQHLRDQAEVAS